MRVDDVVVDAADGKNEAPHAKVLEQLMRLRHAHADDVANRPHCHAGTQ